MKIEIKYKDFQKYKPATEKTIIYDTTIEELVAFASLYGYRVSNPNYSELVRKAITIFNALDANVDGFSKTNDYENGVRDEKVYTSYVIGMTLCAFIARKELGFNELLHLDLFEKHFNIKVLPTLTKKSPDFIAYNDDKDEYLVIEAKGTVGGYSSSMITDGTEQVSQIAAVNRKTPLKVVTLSYFNKYLMAVAQNSETIKGVSIEYGANVNKLQYEITQNIFKSIDERYREFKIINDDIVLLNISEELKEKIKEISFVGQSISGTDYFIGIADFVLEDTYDEYKNNQKLIYEIRKAFNFIDDKALEKESQIDDMQSKNKIKGMYIGQEGIIIAKRELFRNKVI